MAVGQICVAGGRAVATVPEQLADLGQVLAADDGLAGHGVSQVVQARPAEVRIAAHRAPAGGQAGLAASFGIAREQERVRVARAGQCDDERSPFLRRPVVYFYSGVDIRWHRWIFSSDNSELS